MKLYLIPLTLFACVVPDPVQELDDCNFPRCPLVTMSPGMEKPDVECPDGQLPLSTCAIDVGEQWEACWDAAYQRYLAGIAQDTQQCNRDIELLEQLCESSCGEADDPYECRQSLRRAAAAIRAQHQTYMRARWNTFKSDVEACDSIYREAILDCCTEVIETPDPHGGD